MENPQTETNTKAEKPECIGTKAANRWQKRKTENPNAPLILHTNIGMHIL